MKPPSFSKPRSPTTDAIQLQGRRTRQQALLPRTTSDSAFNFPRIQRPGAVAVHLKVTGRSCLA